MSEKKSELKVQNSFLIYESEDGQIKLDVRLEDETLWLTQPLMAELFNTSIPNISMHIRNIYEEEELQPEATLKKFLTVRQEDHARLNVILSRSNENKLKRRSNQREKR